jgi:D,D-heptose 1,7-bisphosphate phosphatase
MRATVRQCVVMVDGPGPALPALLREFLRFGVNEFLLLTAHEPQPPAEALAAKLPRPARIAWCHYPAGASAGAALFHAHELLHDRFLWREGTAPLEGNLADLLSASGRGDAFRFPGVAVLERRLVLSPPPGWPDVAARITQRRGEAFVHRPALFLDRDGVINVDHGYVGTRDRFEWVDGAREAIRFATQAGWHVFIVTNQSGVARGKYTEADVRALLDWIADEARAAGGTIDDDRYCPFHEDAVVDAYRRGSDWRKPAPGMLLDLMRAWDLTPAGCIMIGDQATDMLAAERAGVSGHLFRGGNLLEFVRPILNRFGR